MTHPPWVALHSIAHSFIELEAVIQKHLNDPDNHDGVITHLEPDFLECKVKWALGSITRNKASGGDGIPAELVRILKVDASESPALNTPANLENSAVATGLEKVSFHSNPKEKESRNGTDLTEAEDIKKRWQEYTEELYKKELHNPDISHFHCIIIRDLI